MAQSNPTTMDGFAFVEFSAPDSAPLRESLYRLGLTERYHPDRQLWCYHNEAVYFFVSEDPTGFHHHFQTLHGPCAPSMAFWVDDRQTAIAHLKAEGATFYEDTEGARLWEVPAIRGIGDSLLYLVEKGESILTDGFTLTREAMGQPTHLATIDHLTHNVFAGEMDAWANFYERLFGFKEIRYFDIDGEQTGLLSRAMSSPCGKAKIPLNESKDPKSQIAEYLEEYRGMGIQHIALTTDVILDTVSHLRENGLSFLDVPDTYYEMIDARIPGHGESLNALADRKILIDGNLQKGQGLLLQIFTQNLIGPIFFEIIQRKGNEGFGEGNFQALFESIERDQMRRGVL